MRTRTGVMLGASSVLLVLSLGHGTRAQQDQVQPLSRVGVVNVMKIMQDCKRNADHIAESQAEAKKLNRQLLALDKELDLEKAKLKTFLPGTDDHLEQAKRVGSQQVHLKVLQEHYLQKAQAQERDWQELLFKDVLAAAQKTAEARGLDMVFNRSEPEYPIPADRLFMAISTHKLIYSRGCIDITDEVIAEIDR